MPLPTLEVTKYELIIPSTGKLIQFRPFLVKEEKILLIAQESGDLKQIVQAMKDIVDVCTFQKVDVDKLTSYDLEYIFIQLRAKSVGEVAELHLPCSHCKKLNAVPVNLEDVKVVHPVIEIDNNIKLNESVGVILKPMTVADLAKVNEESDVVELISICIESIYDDNTVYPAVDSTKEELFAFVETLSHKQLESIQKYIENQPALRHTVQFKCIHCSESNELTIDGLQSFFE